MNRLVPITLFAVAAAGCATPHAGTHWSYAGADGPAHWGALSPEFAACSSGKRQSPIDLAPSADQPLPALAFDDPPGSIDLLNNGHTIVATPRSGGRLTVGADQYQLTQFHFHHPAEHTVDGKRAAIELHLVHKGARGLAVVAVLVEEGASNAAIASLRSDAPAQPGEHAAVATPFDPLALLPVERSYFRYDGSLTAPPCSENVTWLVLRTPITMAPDEIAALARFYPDNSRPLQPRNDRPVTRSQ